MIPPSILAILNRVKSGSMPVEEAAAAIAGSCELDLGFARLDTDRPRRRGASEVIYGPGKTSEQIVSILKAMREAGQNGFVTRVSTDQAAVVLKAIPEAAHHEKARAITLDSAPLPEPRGLVVVASAGTSDIPVAEEAALTAERMGARVERVYDVGVAGLHRTMKHLDLFRKANAVVVVAGMEGALPSVIGGLIDTPIIGVPTSVGYGTNLAGFTPLMAMLNSCASGITVVNIDNGFGAGFAAALINRVNAE